MVRDMGIFKADISLLVAEIAEGDKSVVYPDLVYTIKHSGAYKPPIVYPENGHLRVACNYDFYRACRDAGLKQLLCEVPDHAESRLPPVVKRAELPKESAVFWFYDTTPGVDYTRAVAERIKGFCQEVGKKSVESCNFDSSAECVALKLTDASKTEPYLYNSVTGFVLALEKELGHLRSINGIKPVRQ